MKVQTFTRKFNNFSSKTFNFIFITGSDSTEFIEKTKNLSAQETVFFISSKSLTTTETLEGFELAKNWLGNELKPILKITFCNHANEKRELFLKKNSTSLTMELRKIFHMECCLSSRHITH